MNGNMKGQSLMELLVAMAVFILTISAITFLILDSYTAHRAGQEYTIATLLAEEGIEAARSIRDREFKNLVDGEYGIATSGIGWIFQGVENDVSDQLMGGIRKIIISTVDIDRKEIESKVTWEFSEGRSQEVVLVTYLTNWQKEPCWGLGDLCDSLCLHLDYGPLTDYYVDPGCSESCSMADSFYANPSGECSNDGTGVCYKMEATTTQYTSCSQGTGCLSGCGGTCTPCDQFGNPPSCGDQLGCYWQGKKCRGGCQSCDFFITQPSCEAQAGCSWQAVGWNWNLADPIDGSSSYTACEWYVP